MVALPPRRVLVIDDEAVIRELLCLQLGLSGYDCVVARDGPGGLELARTEAFDLIVLDLLLPGLDGISVCRAIRRDAENPDTPILMLTARREEADKVIGLESGADDYVTKPFSLRELTARVRAVLRRATPVGDRPPAGYRGTHLVADFEAVSVAVDGAAVRLTRREFELLRYLVQNKARVVSRDRLLERVWGYERVVETRSVDVHVGRLRTKLGEAARQIETVIGLGYRFVD